MTCKRILLELARKPLGKVSDYLSKIGVAIITLVDNIYANERVQIEGTTTSFIQDVFSIEIDHKKSRDGTGGSDDRFENQRKSTRRRPRF